MEMKKKLLSIALLFAVSDVTAYRENDVKSKDQQVKELIIWLQKNVRSDRFNVIGSAQLVSILHDIEATLPKEAQQAVDAAAAETILALKEQIEREHLDNADQAGIPESKARLAQGSGAYIYKNKPDLQERFLKIYYAKLQQKLNVLAKKSTPNKPRSWLSW